VSRGSANSEYLRFGIGPAAHGWGFFKRRFWGDYVRRLQWAVSRRYMPVEKLTAICNDPNAATMIAAQ